MKILAGHHKGVPVLRIKADRIDGAAAEEFRKALTDLSLYGLVSFVIDLSEGLGIVKELMEDVRYESTGGQNVLTMSRVYRRG